MLAGTRTWGVCSGKDNSPEWEASRPNIEARFALLAYVGIEI